MTVDFPIEDREVRPDGQRIEDATLHDVALLVPGCNCHMRIVPP